MRTNSHSCDHLCMCLPVFITWWCAAPCQRCPNCCGAVSWPDGRGSDTTAPTAAASAGLSARRTTVPADTPPPGKGEQEAMVTCCTRAPSQATTVNVLACTSAAGFPPFGTFGRSLHWCLWSAALRGCIGSECCPELGPSGRIRIRCRPTSGCCPATKNRGKIMTMAAWTKIKSR